MLDLLGAFGLDIDPAEMQKAVETVQRLDGRLLGMEAALARIEAVLAAKFQISPLGPPSSDRVRVAGAGQAPAAKG
jgi:hypothetical protein